MAHWPHSARHARILLQYSVEVQYIEAWGLIFVAGEADFGCLYGVWLQLTM
jgi:hypothetical protein